MKGMVVLMNKGMIKKMALFIMTVIVFMSFSETMLKLQAASGYFRTETKQLVIAIDPGHGGEEEGAKYEYNGEEILEKDLNLAIGLYLYDELTKYENVTVVLTRDCDTELEPQQRIDIAKAAGADIFISIHNNANAEKPSRGTMVLCDYSQYQAPGARTPNNYMVSSFLGQYVLAGLTGIGLEISTDMDEWGGCNGIVRRPYSPEGGASSTTYYEDGSVADFYFQLRFTTEAGIPAIIIEHAYISSVDDFNDFLSSPEKLQALAIADADAIAKAYHLVRK